MTRLPILLLAVVLVSGLLGACRSVGETRALRRVDFGLVGVRDAVLAGQPIGDVDDLADLPPSSVAVVAAGVLRGSLPLRFGLEVSARNPIDNPQARVARFDWTLFLDDREAATGTFDNGPTIAPGDSATFVVPVEVDLVEAAGRNASEILRMALAVAGRRADPTRVRVEARPYVDTPFGQIPLRTETVVARSVGGRPAAQPTAADTTQTRL
ncbi:MAG TPA: LEA type 2 family protein [Rubricoccaceae bacterium]|jgi:hypothetical protein